MLTRLLKNSLAGETACPTRLQTVDSVLVAQAVPPAIAALREFFSNLSRMAVRKRHGATAYWSNFNCFVSSASRASLVGNPPPKPVSFPFAPITRWHGITIGIGF